MEALTSQHDDFLESIAPLPAELNKVFELARELDGKAEALYEDLCQSRTNSEDPRWEQCIRTCDEKIELAESTYDMVDGHVRSLDAVLHKFEAELHLPASHGFSGRDSAGIDSGAAAGGDSALQWQSDHGMPVDPHEPKYCYCNKVSYGNMVACDNDHCPFEWFHYECVGITEEPAGAWKCRECTKT